MLVQISITNLKQSTVVFSSATGEWCYTDTREWPAEPDTETDHYQEYHAGDETNTHTHNITIVTIHHVYEEWIADCDEG